jgi:hypothetical protein
MYITASNEYKDDWVVSVAITLKATASIPATNKAMKLSRIEIGME